MPEPPDFGSVPDTGGHIVQPLPTFEQRLGELERDRDRRSGAFWVLSGLGALLVPGVLAVFGWTWNLNSHVTVQEGKIARLEERLADHRARGGPQGHPDSVISRTTVNEGRIVALERNQDRTDSAIRQINGKLDAILERLPRRGRGSR